ncbi:Translocon-associated protein, gamma subunit [Ostertagia ostertagi]
MVNTHPLYARRFTKIHKIIQVAESWIVWIISAVASTYFLSMACKNQKRLLKHQIVMKRGSAVDREISQKYANDKKMSTKEKEVIHINTLIFFFSLRCWSAFMLCA